ncbi:HNH endonuclease [Neorhizobium sp. JUb45]|nr:HNH endonuclease [Neorhizobium sp. JUb45]
MQFYRADRGPVLWLRLSSFGEALTQSAWRITDNIWRRSRVFYGPKGSYGLRPTADTMIRHAKPRISGIARAEASSRGVFLLDAAHSLLTKKSNGARIMGKLSRIRTQKMIEQNGLCYYCGLQMWDGSTHQYSSRSKTNLRLSSHLRCTAEHLCARSDGGGDTSDNIVAACWFCNSARHKAKKPLTPLAYRYYVQRRMEAGRWLASFMVSVESFHPSR